MRALGDLLAPLRGRPAPEPVAPAAQRLAIAEPVVVATPEPVVAEPEPVVAVEPESVVAVEPVVVAAPRPDRHEPLLRPVQLEPALARQSLRGFVRRLVAAGPADVKVDLQSWQGVAVDRFFAAMTAPGLFRRLEPPTTGGEHVSLGNAFAGFEWE